jgi:hypothetical protein
MTTALCARGVCNESSDADLDPLIMMELNRGTLAAVRPQGSAEISGKDCLRIVDLA